MEMGTVLSVVQTVLSVLGSQELKEALSIFGYKSQLDGLKQTVERINAVLCDAEAKQQLSAQEQNFIEKLKDAAFEADDLFDEVLTLAAQKKLVKTDGNISQKLTNLLSRSKNPFTMSRKIKRIEKKLDAIASNNQFSFKTDPQPLRERIHRETDSYVDETTVIGREDDLQKIVGTLLASSNDPKSNNNASVISIVGIGGLGKTALAQLVYNDPRVREAFHLKMWTCVSDDGENELNVKSILGKILASITGTNPDQGSTKDHVQIQLRKQLDAKKYLLVLDDVWTEKRDQWCELLKYLIENERGSWILVTTRSLTTAAITGGHIHELSGLSEENSWQLFQRSAFDLNQPDAPVDDLLKIGRKIVDGCAGVPLAIKVAGSLLYGQSKNKWLSVQNIGLSNIRDADNGIVPILELSFHNLESHLKNCFRYCAVFPKDHELKKEVLINLWMAQGYVVPLETGQSIDDAGEEYFSILLKRCFFQDIEKNEDGEIKSCKIHDLMHDIAQKVSGKEIFALTTLNGKVDKDVRHLSILNWSQFEKCFSLGSTHIRSLLPIELRPPEDHHCELPMEALVKSFKRLRVLDLSEKSIKCLPDSIGKLLHLRYLDLSDNKEMKALPDSITKLCNLQFLFLNGCYFLRELPKDFNRLVELRVFDIKGSYLPTKGMGKLTSLHTLKGEYRLMYESWKQWLDALEDLKSLVNLKGKLEMEIAWPNQYVKNDTQEDRLREGLYLSSLEHLDYLHLSFYDSSLFKSGRMEDEGMRMRAMEALQPHSNLKSLKVWRYEGTEMPGWITLLPHLVKLELSRCYKLKYLPCLGKLCHVKDIVLFDLRELEYIKIEESSRELASTSSTAQNLSFYPSLQHLELCDLPKWKGWRRGVELELITHLSLPQLKELEIYKSKEFTCSILCPMLETLKLEDFNEGMQIDCTNTNDEKSSDEAAINVPNLKELTVSNGAWLDSMPVESFQSLQKLKIYEDRKIVKLPNNLQYLSALQTLEIEYCENLTEMPNWMPKLTSLKRLHIIECSKRLEKRCKKDPPGEDWPLIQHIPNISFSY